MYTVNLPELMMAGACASRFRRGVIAAPLRKASDDRLT